MKLNYFDISSMRSLAIALIKLADDIENCNNKKCCEFNVAGIAKASRLKKICEKTLRNHIKEEKMKKNIHYVIKNNRYYFSKAALLDAGQ